MIVFALKLRTPKTALLPGLTAIDWLGTAAIVGSVLMFLLGLQFGGVTDPWDSATVLCLIIFGLVTAVIFFFVEWRVSRYPLVPLHIFKGFSNVASLLASWFHGLAFIAVSFYLPLYFQGVLGAKPLLSGIYLLPYAISISATSAATGIYIQKTGRYVECVSFGFFFLTLGLGLSIDLPGDRLWSKIVIYQIIAGVGSGPNFQAPLVALQTGVNQRDIATATATFNFTRNVATSIGVVLGSVLFSNTLSNRGDSLRKSLGDRTAGLLTGGNAEANVFIVDKLPAAQRSTARNAYLKSLQKTWILFTCISACGLAISLLIRRQTLSKDREDVDLGLEAEEAKRKATQERRLARKTKELANS